MQDTTINASTTGTISNSVGYEQQLRRDQNPWQLVRFGLLCMLPIAPTQVWASAHAESFGMSALVYVIGALAMLFTALSYKHMTSEFPVAGSAYSYVQRGMHPWIGFLAGWLIIMDYSIIPGMLIKFSTTWMSAIVPEDTASILTPIMIILFAAIVTTIVAVNGKIANWINNFFFFGQLSLIALFLIAAFKFVIIDGNGVGHFSLTPFYNPDTFTFAGIASAATLGMLGFIGFDSIATQSEETKNARKVVGRSVVLSLIIIALLFLSQAYMASLVHPAYTDLDMESGMGYFDVIREAAGDWLYYAFIILGVIFVGIANAVPVMSAISRVLFAMGRDNALPFSKFFSKVNSKYQTPMNATLFIGTLSVIVAFTLSLDFLSRLVNFGAMSTYFLLNIAVIVHFLFKKKDFSLKGILNYGLLPLIGASVIGFIFSGFNSATWTVGLVWLAIGVVVLLVRMRKFKEVPPIAADL
ncbi:APC family permease [Paenibacillus pabuli]|uniref:APC family permease n=1 Tax=Paenibacillus pabuli TaxID=1472 RepID=UPI0032423072